MRRSTVRTFGVAWIIILIECIEADTIAFVIVNKISFLLQLFILSNGNTTIYIAKNDVIFSLYDETASRSIVSY